MKTYILFDAGCDILEIEKFDITVEWHHNEFQGTYAECVKEKAHRENKAMGMRSDMMADAQYLGHTF